MRKEQGRPSGRGNSISEGPEIVNRGSFAVSMYAVVKTWNRGRSGPYGPYQGKPPWVLSFGFGLYSVCLGQLLKVFEQWHDSSSKSKAEFWRVAVGGGLLWQTKSWGSRRNIDKILGKEEEHWHPWRHRSRAAAASTVLQWVPQLSFELISPWHIPDSELPPASLRLWELGDPLYPECQTNTGCFPYHLVCSHPQYLGSTACWSSHPRCFLVGF